MAHFDEKNTFLTIKRCFFCQFLQKCFKTPEKLSLAVCGSCPVSLVKSMRHREVWLEADVWYPTNAVPLVLVMGWDSASSMKIYMVMYQTSIALAFVYTSESGN